LPKNGQDGEQVDRDEVLTGIGPVLTFVLTRERWKRSVLRVAIGSDAMGLGDS